MRGCFRIVCTSILIVAGCQASRRPSTEFDLRIQPLGQVRKETLDGVVAALRKTYRATVTIAPPQDLPREAFYRPRSRYRADRLLDVLDTEIPSGKRVLGVTGADISTTKEPNADWGIFGLGRQPGRSCVVSSYRLGKPNSSLAMERLCRVAIHEVGHTLGLDHCPNPRCIMSDAKGGLKSVDAGDRFCPTCRSNLGGKLR